MLLIKLDTEFMLCLSLWVVSHAYSLKHGCAHVTNDGSLIPRGSLGTHLWPAEAWLNDSQFLVKRSLPKPANGCPTYDCIGLLLMWQLSLGKEQRNLETTTLLHDRDLHIKEAHAAKCLYLFRLVVYRTIYNHHSQVMLLSPPECWSIL